MFIKIDNINKSNDSGNSLGFTIEGDFDSGLDKSVINAIRRTIIEDIPTVGFNFDENSEEKDIIIRAFKFSQGQREEVIVIGDDCHIYLHKHITDKDIEPNLIKQVCSILLYVVLANEEI